MNDILFETSGRAGIVTLNRPKALNALTEAMIAGFDEALAEWARDDAVQRVVVRAVDGKAFCAGGDLRIIEARRAGAIDFFAAEYRLNHRIATYAKPFIALIDGICMGGGVGVSVHGSHRIASENLVFAMPEVGVGLVPDVGSTHVLAQMADEAGMWLGLTGARLGRDEAASVGFVTHPVEASRLGDALDRAAHARQLAALDDLADRPEPRAADVVAVLAEAFAATTVAAVLDRLDAAEHQAAADAARDVRTKSPTSIMVAFEAIRRAKGRSITECIATEFRIVSRILDGHDLYEGIRATLIDKDNRPRWDPAELDKVDPGDVEAHFAEAPLGDLDLTATTPVAPANAR